MTFQCLQTKSPIAPGAIFLRCVESGYLVDTRVIEMSRREEIERWIGISDALIRDLLPPGAGLEAFGIGIAPDAFAMLVDREASRVDHVLIAMAEAEDGNAVCALRAQLSPDTLIALFSRWAHYTKAWRQMLDQSDPQLWVPPKTDQIWRAVLLAMTGENIHSTAAARRIWPEVFAVQRG